MRLPHDISDVDELPSRLCEEARWLIGFWMNHGLAEPAIRRSNWARTPAQAAFYWGQTIKLRLAHQVDRIRHWKIIEGSWQDAPDIDAHYFVDPPYANQAGRSYRYNNINRTALAKWCKRRRGFVHVCENDGANWLPFEPFSIVANCYHRGYSAEVVFEMDN
jgi:hypothetical protein